MALSRVDLHCVVLASLSWQIHTGRWSLPHWRSPQQPITQTKEVKHHRRESLWVIYNKNPKGKRFVFLLSNLFAFPTLFKGRSNVTSGKVKTSFQPLKVALIVFCIVFEEDAKCGRIYIYEKKFEFCFCQKEADKFLLPNWSTCAWKPPATCFYFALDPSAEINPKSFHKAESDKVNKWFDVSLTWVRELF